MMPRSHSATPIGGQMAYSTTPLEATYSFPPMMHDDYGESLLLMLTGAVLPAANWPIPSDPVMFDNPDQSSDIRTLTVEIERER